MFNFWKNLFCFAFAPLYFGGDGGESTSTTTTVNTSNQLGVAEGGLGFLAENSDVTINQTMTDAGAIGEAFSFGKDVIKSNENSIAGFLEAGTSVFDKFASSGTDVFRMATNANESNYDRLLKTTSSSMDNLLNFGRDAVTQSMKSISEGQRNVAALVDTANSKGTMDNRTMMMLGLGGLAVVAAFIFKGKK